MSEKWTDPILQPRVTKVKTAHIEELRESVAKTIDDINEHRSKGDSEHPVVTTTTAGFMSPEDKIKVDGYTHTQIAPSDTWVIDHNRDKFPSVSVTDSAGSLVVGDVNYISSNRVIVMFSSPFAGTAFLN